MADTPIRVCRLPSPRKTATGGTAVRPQPTISYFGEQSGTGWSSYYARTKGLVSSLPAPAGSVPPPTTRVNQATDIPMFHGQWLGGILPTDNSAKQPGICWNCTPRRYVPVQCRSALEISRLSQSAERVPNPPIRSNGRSRPSGCIPTAFWGAAERREGHRRNLSPAKTVILNDIPTQPMVSLGQYHAYSSTVCLTPPVIGNDQPFACPGNRRQLALDGGAA